MRAMLLLLSLLPALVGAREVCASTEGAVCAPGQPDDASSLLQLGTKVATRKATPPKGGASTRSPTKCLDTTGYPDVGPVYKQEQLPLLEAFRVSWVDVSGCEDPHSAEADKPIVEVLKPGENGYCYFDFFTQCVKSERLGTWMPQSIWGAQGVLHGGDPGGPSCPGGYETGPVKTAPGVNFVDAELCYNTGYINLPHEMAANFTAMNEFGEKRCEYLKSKYPEQAKTLNFALSNVASTWGPSYWDMYYLKSCLMWQPYGVACDAAYCAYNACLLPDGRVGEGLQCNKEWLDKKVLKEYQSELDLPSSLV